MLRRIHKQSWPTIASQVKNLAGRHPYWKVCRDAYKRFDSRLARPRYKYGNCGRKAKLTSALRKWLVRRLLALRKSCVCTSTTLQRELANKKRVIVEASSVRRALQLAGYRWLRRSKKPRYSPEVRAERVVFSREVLAMTPSEFRDHLHLAMDGVVVVVPPKGVVARENFCRNDDMHVWRKPSEGSSPDVAGGDKCNKQAPITRTVPFWGGVADGGVAVVLWHDARKVTSEEWAQAVNAGKLTRALIAVNHRRRRGPWRVLCDNETFLRAEPSRKAHERCGVTLWKMPAKSPDLNPVEKFWAWLRRRLCAMDLRDLAAKRPPVGRTACKVRVRNIMRTRRARQVAARCVRNLRKVAAEVIRKRGAAARG